ncbi:MAG: N-acetylmuramoyl-L-alanine amidase [Chitinophagaceae bacterium]|nr:N-acetylmuramoyl-L-alanine amidase [Chitinophagaceae bacterium]
MNPKKSIAVALCFLVLQSCSDKFYAGRKKTVVVWQPSHQTDTGKDFSEAAVCNAIAEAAMKTNPRLKEYKVWSLGKTEYHHSDSGSNTKILHTSAVIDGKISGYAFELQESNKLKPSIFISVHNNGGTKRNAVWGYIHYGDTYEKDNRDLAAQLIKAISEVSGLENRGVLLDSTTGRNDYRCQATGKLGFTVLMNIPIPLPIVYYSRLVIMPSVVSCCSILTASKDGAAIKKALTEWIRIKACKNQVKVRGILPSCFGNRKRCIFSINKFWRHLPGLLNDQYDKQVRKYSQ